MELDAVEVLGAAEDAEDEVIELGRRSEQETPVNGAGGDLDDGAWRDEA